jgi:hypothetical protein
MRHPAWLWRIVSAIGAGLLLSCSGFVGAAAANADPVTMAAASPGAAATAVAPSPTPPAQGGTSTVAFEPIKGFGQPVVQARINGGTTSRFMIDTGCATTSLTLEFAERLGLRPQRPGAYAGALKNGDNLGPCSVQLGTATFQLTACQVWDMQQQEWRRRDPRGIDGIIGADVLSQRPTLLDFDRQACTFFPKGRLTRQQLARAGFTGNYAMPVPMRIEHFQPFGTRFLVPFRVGGPTSSPVLTLDTGAEVTVLPYSDNQAVANEGMLGGENCVTLPAGDRSVSIDECWIDSAYLGQVELPDALMVVMTKAGDTLNGVDGAIGIDSLARTAILLAPDEQALYVRPSSGWNATLFSPLSRTPVAQPRSRISVA